jgi:DNA polymerase III subunit gamma/tau
MAENLFSKYRPLTFDEIVGHDKIKHEFIQRAKDNNWSQAIMISGKTGTGKGCFEKIIAKTILCSSKHENNNPCSLCEPCQTVINEKVSQYYYMFNASNLGIDEMRSIEEVVAKKVLSSIQTKIIVVDELQELGSNQRALKSILKILEKPIKNVHFLLMAMDESKIPTALKNRCVHYRLKDLSFDDISKRLYEICVKENIEITTKEKASTLITLAQNSDGSMRTAISYLERCIYSELWNPDTVLSELGIVSNDTIGLMINKLMQGDITIFEQEITKDILDKIRWVLNLYYKHQSGVKLNQYHKSFISSIKEVKESRVASAIDTLNKLTYFPYINQELIDFSVVEIIRKNRVLESVTNTQSVTSDNNVVQEVKIRERKRVDQ